MLLIHRVIRRELDLAPRLVRGANGDLARSQRVGPYLTEMLYFLHTHHSGEDERILPLVSELFSQGEWDKLGEHGFGAVPPRRRFVVLGHILEEATPPERARFMQKVPPPARLVYRLFGRRQYEREAAGIRSLASQPQPL